MLLLTYLLFLLVSEWVELVSDAVMRTSATRLCHIIFKWCLS